MLQKQSILIVSKLRGFLELLARFQSDVVGGLLQRGPWSLPERYFAKVSFLLFIRKGLDHLMIEFTKVTLELLV
jgi:hypothetical protein